MEKNKISNLMESVAERIAERNEANKGYEYEGFYLFINYAVARGGYIKQIGPRAFGVFIVIRTYMNRDKIAFPELRTIKRLTGLSINTIRKDIDILIKYGWLQKTVDRKNNGEFDTAKYMVLQRDVVRGTGDASFRRKPVLRLNNGS